ncbi:MAG: rod shape-determining protein RodA [Desulfotomaculales bacterium]
MSLARMFRGLDYTLLLTAAGIIFFGLVVIGSASLEFTDDSFSQLTRLNFFVRLLHLDFTYVIRQFFWVLAGLFFMLLVIYFPYEDLVKQSRLLYFLNLVLLAAVLFKGHTAYGAQRWIGVGPLAFQPSEFAKIFIIITLAGFLAKKRGNLNRFRDLLSCFCYVGIPLLLILAQPDLGTSLVFLAVMFAMLFFADARPLLLVEIVGAGLIFVFVLVAGHAYLHDADLNLEKELQACELQKKEAAAAGNQAAAAGLEQKYADLARSYQSAHRRHELFHKYTLKEYQMTRLFIFLNPESDLLGDGYQIWQSLISIGSGGFTGKGLLGGTQTHFTFLPVRHTDFIFSVVGEEFGFAGAVILLGLYFLVILRGIRIMLEARDFLGSLLSAGVVSLFAFHVFVNVGMTSGIMPVTGIPLPLFSYGGSNMIMSMTALGLLESVYVRRKKILF